MSSEKVIVATCSHVPGKRPMAFVMEADNPVGFPLQVVHDTANTGKTGKKLIFSKDVFESLGPAKAGTINSWSPPPCE